MAFKSPAPLARVEPQEVTLQLAGGNSFGRYNKISDSQTWNMIVSDGVLVDYAGYQNVFENEISINGKGRGIYTSTTGNIMVVVIGSAVYAISSILNETFVGNLETSSGDVFISENNNNQIAIADESFLYVYNYLTNPAGPLLQSIAPPPATDPPTPWPVGTNPGAAPPNRFYAAFLKPGYVSFHLGRLIVADLDSTIWWLSGINDATQWDLNDTNNQAYENSIDLKPDTIQAVVAFPGAGDNVAVFGQTVMELWQNVGAAVFPYQRATTFNVDYGCLNASSIAALDSYIVWLSSNEQGGTTIMKIDGAGNREQSISTDGIDFKLSDISDPTNCTAFLFRQDGHLLYQFTFPTNNVSYVYDFNTKLFFTVSDENQNYHIARNVVFFGNDYYFVSFNDGNVYTFGTQFTNLQYSANNIQQMPRIRILPPIRLPSQRMFICKSVGFTVENGQSNIPYISDAPTYWITQDDNLVVAQYTPPAPPAIPINLVFNNNATLNYSECIDLRVSRDGGETFSSAIRYYMNPTGNRRSRLIFQRLGQQNDLTIQIQFIGFQRFIAFDGVAEVYT